MSVFTQLFERVVKAAPDAELGNFGRGLDARIRVVVDADAFGIVVDGGRLTVVSQLEEADVLICADGEAWSMVLALPPPPTFHSFTALELANPRFAVSGAPLMIARCRPVLERIIELVVEAPELEGPLVHRDITSVVGSYAPVDIKGEMHHLYAERAGKGIPVLFLHTAGADSRQFHGQLSDVGLASAYAMFAVDLPFHGRSMPPVEWRGEPYWLTKDRYLSWCEAILEHVLGEPAVIVGGSMGAAMALVLAAERPDLVRGVVAVEPPFRSKGRRNPFQHHAGVHGSLHNASYVRGLMSPLSAESDRRRASWIYSQGAPGIYTGDLAFYSDEFDGAEIGPRIDCTETPVVLLCGDYDYSASPADGRKLLEVIPGAHITEMPGLGHFPMCENPDAFRPYLMQALKTAC
ncbi:alpha/beta hydrolase [Cupriavidus sp. 8B]